MTAFRGLIVAAALAGSIALVGAKPAAAQGLTNEELVIGGLLVASGLLLYEEFTNNGHDHDRWRRHRHDNDRWRRHRDDHDRDRWREHRRDHRQFRNFQSNSFVPPAFFRGAPPGRFVAERAHRDHGLRLGKRHKKAHRRGRDRDHNFRHRHGFDHRR